MKKYPTSRKDKLVVQELDGEVLIYDLNINKAFCLNETSALVWRLCDGNRSATEISKYISKKLNSPANEDLVWLAIDQLKKEKLIDDDDLENNFAGMSRREVIRKVGLGTMIALPVVASLIVPSAIFAQSCGSIPNGSPAPGCGTAPGSGNNVNCQSCCCNFDTTCAVAGALAPGAACVKDCRCASGNCRPNGRCQ